MMDRAIKALFAQYQNVVLLGETGSGKSEVGINLGIQLATTLPGQQLHLFDMDQTKPLFRLRDIDEADSVSRLTIHYQNQVMDSPVVVGGVEEAIQNPQKYVIVDVGGGAQGARLIGQFCDVLKRKDTLALYLINSYRPWSLTPKDFMETMSEIVEGSGLDRFCFVANPNLGSETTCNDVVKGYFAIREKLGIEPQFLCALVNLADEVRASLKVPVLPIRMTLATSKVETMNNA